MRIICKTKQNKTKIESFNLQELLPKVFSNRYARIFSSTLLKEINRRVYNASHIRSYEPDEVVPDFGGSKRKTRHYK